MRKLTSILALAVIATIAGQVGGNRQAAVESRNESLPPAWNAAPGQALMRACGNCHSNRTNWPWYSRVAPVSWWLARDVREGREKLNFSAWAAYSDEQRLDQLDSICGLIATGRMPPRLYASMHPEAKLNDKDKNAVCAWVKAQAVGAK